MLWHQCSTIIYFLHSESVTGIFLCWVSYWGPFWAWDKGREHGVGGEEEMLKLIVLGWPKFRLDFSVTSLQKNQTFWPTLYFSLKKQVWSQVGYHFVVVVSHVQLFVTPWTAAHQASLSFTISRSLLKFMSIESVMPSNHLILCAPLSLWCIKSVKERTCSSPPSFLMAYLSCVSGSHS